MKCIEYMVNNHLQCGETGLRCNEQNCPRGKAYYNRVMNREGDSSFSGERLPAEAEENGE